MKLTSSQTEALRRKIKHIVGECNCSPNSKTCAYWATVDKGGATWQTDLIIKEIKKL